MTPGDRRPEATSAEVEGAITALARRPVRIPARAWPGDLEHLDQPGMYSWWVDPAGALALSEGLEHRIDPGRIYAGQTGATKWPSGQAPKTTLAARIGSNHLRGTIYGSTFRLTLASVLRDPLDLVISTPGHLDHDSERSLSGWIGDHLEVAVYPFPMRDALSDLEHRVLLFLDPALNLDGMPPTPVRAQLRQLRSLVTSYRGGTRF